MSRKKNKRSKASAFKVFKFGVKLTFKTMPGLFISVNILSILQGLAFGLSILFTQQFYDSVSEILTKNEPLSQALLMITLVGFILIAREIINGIFYLLHNTIYNKLIGELTSTIHDKMERIDPICMEDTKLHEDIDKAVGACGSVHFIFAMGMTLLTYYIPYFIFIGLYLHHLKPEFVLAILLVFVPVFITQFGRTGIIAKFEDTAAPIRREYEYYKGTIVGREYFKETRILGAHSFFLTRFFAQLKKLGQAEWSKNKRINILELIMGLIRTAGYAGILYMLVTALLAGEISVGAFAAVFTSIAILFERMNEVVNGLVARISEFMGTAHNFTRFMELPERGGMDMIPDFSKGIVAENISFSYPNSKSKSVNNVSLKINAGETISIVGENGAGKTTLVRLLIGLYTPHEGKVLLNGMDTAQTNKQSLYSSLSGVFQRFQKYQMTLNENIQISDIDSESNKCGNRMNQVINQAGVEINGTSFPNGGETMLSREFDGVDLSGGEWQRVAVARGLYRFHDVIILDEPTASIDPIEESKIYKKFIEISKGKTAIIVTHRLGSTKIADRVVVMDKGSIVDIGSHFELLKKGGLYAEMYNAQAGWYARKEDRVAEET